MDLLSLQNLLVTRSLTKAHGLASLRLGYTIGDESIIRALKQARPPWNVNAIAQAAGIAALAAQEYVDACMNQIAVAKAALVDDLKHIGLTPSPSETNYFLLDVGSGSQVRNALLRDGICVRDCASFGLPEYIRIAVRLPIENERLVRVLSELNYDIVSHSRWRAQRQKQVR
ncbi:aminotransferase class I/II-fold pyridoxal phosphate-dependent enzyme [Chloroflexi bacterium TSY]|nr:aminotransferase class I/II-fold pyridoxal phosphate-dependent enzyme [Chloroflexi bacterium TSY]